MRRILTDFGRALVQAISSSPEAGGTVRKIRDEGLTLYLVLDGKSSGERLARRLDLAIRALSSRHGSIQTGSRPTAPDPPVPAEPVFRINSRDVAFLKSLGIDPTRSVRSRSRRRQPS